MLPVIFSFLIILIFVVLTIAKQQVYYIPLYYLITTSFFGVLSTDVPFTRGLNYGDVTFLINYLILFIYVFLKKKSLKNNPLIKIMLFISIYYFIILFYSIIIQGSALWPIKISRTTLYSINFFVFLFLLSSNTEFNIKKVVLILRIFAIFSSLLYVLYNAFDINLYNIDVSEKAFTDSAFDNVHRNTYLFPILTMYFFFYSQYYFLNNRKKIIVIAEILLYAVTIFYSYSRGLIVISVLLSALIYLRNMFINFKKIIAITIIIILSIPILLKFININQFVFLESRFLEINRKGGIENTTNLKLRNKEFWERVYQVNKFSPLIGYGFVNVKTLGYNGFLRSNAGSPDNAFTNIIGLFGYIGLFLYLLLLFIWLIINRQALKTNKNIISLTNRVYILLLFTQSFTSASLSYIYLYSIFMVLDYYKVKKELI